MVMKLLILGGTSESNSLAERLAGDERYAATLSLAGRTGTPRLPPVALRVGGFGGAVGLAEFLQAEQIDVLIDATHPFAERISANAVTAARLAGVPLLALTRAPWAPVDGDRWTAVDDLAGAAAALPGAPTSVFLTVGRQSLVPFASQPQHHYVIRVIDPPEIPAALVNAEVVVGRGPFQIEAETALLRAHRIQVLVTKNSGGKAASAKLAAARTLGLPVILVSQPKAGDEARFRTVDAVLLELAKRHGVLTKRSV